MPRNPSITDVAAAAGVGVGTVSRVINNAPFVSPAMAAIVRKVVADLGYKPPARDRRHRRRSRETDEKPRLAGDIMLLLVGSQTLRWILDTAPVYSYVLDGVHAALADRGQSLVVRQSPDWTAAAKIVREHAVKGLVLFGGVEADNTVFEILSNVPAVWLMGSPVHFPGDKVQPDHAQLGVLAAEYLLKKGHRRCAYIGTSLGSPSLQPTYRADAFRWCIEEGGGRVEMLLDADLITANRGQNGPNEKVVAKLVDRLLGVTPRPTALLVQADMLTPSIYRQLVQRGVRPQQDMLIVTCNNERPYLMGLDPSPVVIDLQGESIGRRAVEQLLWRIDHAADPSLRILVEPQIIEP